MKRASTGCPASSAEHQDVENLSNSDEESNPATQAATAVKLDCTKEMLTLYRAMKSNAEIYPLSSKFPSCI